MSRHRLVRVSILVAVTAVVSVAAFVPLGSGSSPAPSGRLRTLRFAETRRPGAASLHRPPPEGATFPRTRGSDNGR